MRLARAWRIDECSGQAVAGATSGYWFDCFRNITWEPQIEEGDRVILQNDCKQTCWQTNECDDLTGYNVSFELLNPDYELTELLTGEQLIVDGGENIGIKQTTATTCKPWVGLELFEEVPSDVCVTGYTVRRIVFPKIRFMTPGKEDEGVFRLVPFSGKTTPTPTVGYGTGPWQDSAVDFGTADPDEKAHYLEYFDSSIDLSTTTGQCGYQTVPALP